MNDRHVFRSAVEAGDLGGMIDLFSADAVLHSPVSFEPFRGKKAIGGLLFVLMEVFEDFRYTDELDAEDGTKALIFRAGVGGRELEGVDLLRFDESGRVEELTVLVRPMSGLRALMEAVGPRLESLGTAPSE